jgi:hypothetical protein
MSITVTPRSIAVLATAIDFHLPHGWSDEFGQKVVDAAAARVGNIEQLRDRFAMAALQGLLAAETAEPGSHYDDYQGKTRVQHAASDAYAVADAMLAARSAKAEP